MATLNKMVYDCLNLVYGGAVPDDSDISELLIIYYIEQYRSLLIRQELSQRSKTPETFVQHLPCVDLEEVDKSECCEVTTNCTVVRSTTKLPKTINSNGKNSIVSVSSVDGSRHFSETTFFRAKFNKYNLFTAKQPRWYLKNDYLYLIIDHKEKPTKISVSGIFESPSELASFYTCSGTSCFTRDDEYPVSADMANSITDLIMKNRLSIMRGTPKDLKNDNIDQAAQAGKSGL